MYAFVRVLWGLSNNSHNSTIITHITVHNTIATNIANQRNMRVCRSTQQYVNIQESSNQQVDYSLIIQWSMISKPVIRSAMESWLEKFINVFHTCILIVIYTVYRVNDSSKVIKPSHQFKTSYCKVLTVCVFIQYNSMMSFN